MKNAFLALVLTFGALLLYGCAEQVGSAAGTWTGEVHPDVGALSESVPLGEFPSYAACVEAAMNVLGGEGIFNCSTS